MYINTKMLIQSHFPVMTTLLLLLDHSGLIHTASHRRRINAKRQYKEYKGMLKASNMTSFPDGDIRNLLIDGHEWTRGKDRKSSINSQPEIATKVMSSHIASTNMASVSRRHRKKDNRKGRKRRQKVTKTSTSSTARLTAPNPLWRKKFFAMRREETEELLRAESNELVESTSANTKTEHKEKKLRGSKRKERRREKKRRNQSTYLQSAARPIKGQSSLSLNIARLKQRCKTKPLKQEIKVEGCLSKSIMNNLCYGQCNSFYIPEIRGKGNGPPSFVSCGFCRPKTVRPIYVTLRCTNRRGNTRWKRKKVSFVKKCRCMEQEIDVDSL